MKTLPFICLTLILIGFVVRDGNTQVTIPIVDSTSLFSYQWYLFKMPEVNMYKVDNSRIPNLLFFPGKPGKFFGSAVCNHFKGLIKISGKNRIQFIDIKEEILNCPNEIDPKFIMMLRKTAHFKIQNNLLKLFDKNGILLAKFWAEFTQQSYNVMTALEGDWLQNSLQKPKGWYNLNLLDTLPLISFSKNNPGVLAGFTGCNAFSSRYSLNNSHINFIDTRTFQDNPCKSEIEENFKNYLSAVTMFWVGDELLVFWQGNSMVMDFLRVNSLKLNSGPVWRFLEKKRKRTVYGCSFGIEETE